MAQINITFNTTAKQDAKLAKLLAAANALRRDPEQPFATVEEYLRFILIDAVKSMVQRQTEADADVVGLAYDNASDAVKAQVAALLGV